MALIFLKVDGIPGASTDPNHPGYMDVQSFSMSGTNEISVQASGPAAGRAAFSPLTITKQADAASPGLFLALCLGKRIDTATLVIVPTPSAPPSIRFDFKLLALTGFSLNTSGNTALEVYSFVYGAIQYRYSAGGLGGALPTNTQAGWSVTTNEETSLVPIA